MIALRTLSSQQALVADSFGQTRFRRAAFGIRHALEALNGPEARQ